MADIPNLSNVPSKEGFDFDQMLKAAKTQVDGTEAQATKMNNYFTQNN
jgi:flagellar hook-basal body complex protein FliE|tara:strand:- start:354 stop:497 length:144 start_codon:yes stop_codon:yes gene_type:complete